MDTRPKINPNGTYVLDEEDIEQLDQLSLTSVISAVVDATFRDDPEPKSSGIAASAAEGDTTINKLLGPRSTPGDEPPEQSGFPAEPEPAGDLIAPELVFPDLAPGRRR